MKTSFRTQSLSKRCAAPVSAESLIRTGSRPGERSKSSRTGTHFVSAAACQSLLVSAGRSSVRGNASTPRWVSDTGSGTPGLSVSTTTASRKIIIRRCSKHRATLVPSAGAQIGRGAGQAVRVSITIIRQEKFEVCSAVSAIRDSAVFRMIRPDSVRRLPTLIRGD